MVENVVGRVVEVWTGEMQALGFVPVGGVRVYHFNYKREDQYIGMRDLSWICPINTDTYTFYI